MGQILDGKQTAQAIRDEIRNKAAAYLQRSGIRPGLAVIMVGDDPASAVYVRNKERACQEVGFFSETFRLPADTTQEELESLIDKLNARPDIHGILCQLPLPSHLNEKAVLLRISPSKDVDCFHPYNVGELTIGSQKFLPCTPAGCMALLNRYRIDVDGKKAVVLGRSNIVGKPMALLLLQQNATVTICHTHTKDLKAICREADILVVAIKKPRFITEDYIKEGAVVIDVGINRLENGKLAGDVDFENVFEKVSYITPVPGGVGPMTITMLLQNTLTAALGEPSCN
ncbi:MAG: bifunctional methylenetetrahydrofolate dehydrogenase/methenyltetrahydrofolate cyclohydrolase FolD [Clostridia bacterium]|nr:bifunctional methylenetetrahydrofolate dehydrogenase/methenyltetrahydrofolate cyclohydrolase FolD [Clostridia bacterium]